MIDRSALGLTLGGGQDLVPLQEPGGRGVSCNFMIHLYICAISNKKPLTSPDPMAYHRSPMSTVTYLYVKWSDSQAR